MALRRGEFSIFSMSFLDVISCGFGSILLVFLMVSALNSTNALDRSYVSLRLRLTPYAGDTLIPNIAVPLRAVAFMPLTPYADPTNYHQLMAWGRAYDLRKLSMDIRAQFSRSDHTELCLTFLTNRGGDDGGVAMLRGIQPRSFWVLFLLDRQLRQDIDKLRILESDLIVEGRIDSRRTHLDWRLAHGVQAAPSGYFIPRSNFVDAVVAVRVTMSDRDPVNER